MPEQNTPQSEAPKVEAAKQESIVERVSKFEFKKEEAKDNEQGFTKFDPKAIETIPDPAHRKLVEDAYKSMQADYTRKTQELASQRKDLESKLQAQTSWSKERIAEALKDPEFVRAAQEFQSDNYQENQSGGNLSDEEWSALNEKEKGMLRDQQRMLQAVTQELNSFKVQQQDEQLKNRYANYDPAAVTKLQRDLLSGVRVATREDIWKVADYELAIERAYKMGLEDRKADWREKSGANTPTNGFNMTPSSQAPVREKGESFQNLWKRIAERRMADRNASRPA